MWVDQRTGSEFNVEIGARVVATQAGQIILVDDNEEVSDSFDFSNFKNDFRQELHFPIQTKFRPMHISSVEGVPDMILLGDLKESAILHNLHMRYKDDGIYVSISLRKTRSNQLIFLSSDLHRLDSSGRESLSTIEYL